MRRIGRWSGWESRCDAARAGRTGVGFAPGFTLLELLVVLVLVGLVATLALPNLERLQGAVASKTERDHILDQFAGLGRQAMLERRAYVVYGSGRAPSAGLPGTVGETADARAQGQPVRPREDASSSPRRIDTARAGLPARPREDASGPPSRAGHERYAIDLPDGWEIRLDKPLVVYANGLCLGAGLALYHRGAEDVRVELEPPYCRVAPDA